MARLQRRYICSECGHESPQWMGKCPECEAWDTLQEEVTAREKPPSARRNSPAGKSIVAASAVPRAITEVAGEEMPRRSTGIVEFDRVLGGGIVSGSILLIGGDPGIGKSTLLTQAAYSIAVQQEEPATVLYLSGEESAHQVALRANRLGAGASRFLVGAETDVSAALQHMQHMQPSLVIIDSIQTLYDPELESAPGSVSQVRGCAAQLARFAKESGVPVALIGHVTKEGSLAGPRVLEHLVDAVLTFEGDRQHSYRILRAVKNRFGSTDELAIFEMGEHGLTVVENPSAALLAGRPREGNGSAVTALMEGSRALLVEVQGLSSRSHLASPRRVVNGMDPNRVNMLLAVLEKRLGLKLAEQDVFVNVVGGMRIAEPAADLGVALSVVSSFREQAIEPSTLLTGEVGLSGELRAVGHLEKRLNEAVRMGFTQAVIPRRSGKKPERVTGLKIVEAETLLDAMRASLLPAARISGS